jgi:peptidoglycan/xylan/chitin deacetylase (PgdA/CDA1 family)
MTFHGVPSAAWFRGALQTIGRSYRFISAGDIQAYFYEGKRFNGCCHVCFDDGERSFTDLAVPVLEDLRIPATLFVSPGVLASGGNYWFQEVRFLRQQAGDAALKHEIAALLGREDAAVAPFSANGLLKSLRLADIWQVIEATRLRHGLPPAPPCNIGLDELRSLAKHELLTLGAHTMTHPILQNESAPESERQIRESVDGLAELTGRPVQVFAYPNGTAGLDYGPREQATLAACGIALAFATDTGFFGSGTNPLGIPRAALEVGDSPTKIRSKLLLVPAWDRLRAGKESRERKQVRQQKDLPGFENPGRSV